MRIQVEAIKADQGGGPCAVCLAQIARVDKFSLDRLTLCQKLQPHDFRFFSSPTAAARGLTSKN